MEQELPRLLPSLRARVHLGMDAEFSMHYGARAWCRARGLASFDAKDIKWLPSNCAGS